MTLLNKLFKLSIISNFNDKNHQSTVHCTVECSICIQKNTVMILEINAAIKQNDFQQVKTLVEAIIEEVSNIFKFLL